MFWCVLIIRMSTVYVVSHITIQQYITKYYIYKHKSAATRPHYSEKTAYNHKVKKW